MSQPAGPSSFPAPSLPPTPLATAPAPPRPPAPDFRGSQSSTPAPEPSTPAVASSSALEPDAEPPAPRQAFAADLEAVGARAVLRSLLKGRAAEEEAAMTQTASRCVVAASLLRGLHD